MKNTDRDWQVWGAEDPYYGVLSAERFRDGGSREEFFDTGEHYVAGRLALIEKHFGPINRGRALDFGAGVGRLTIPLSKQFEEVVGLDISPAMIAEAQRNDAAVQFRLSDDDLTNADGHFDFVLSSITLQHIERERGLALLRKLLERTDSFSIQMTSARRTRRSRLAGLIHRIPLGTAAINLKNGMPLSRPQMIMTEYPVHVVLREMQDAGFENVVCNYHDAAGVDSVIFNSKR